MRQVEQDKHVSMSCATQIRRLKADHEQALAQQRQAASVALQQETALIKQTLSKDMRDSNRKTLSEVGAQ